MYAGLVGPGPSSAVCCYKGSACVRVVKGPWEALWLLMPIGQQWCSCQWQDLVATRSPWELRSGTAWQEQCRGQAREAAPLYWAPFNRTKRLRAPGVGFPQPHKERKKAAASAEVLECAWDEKHRDQRASVQTLPWPQPGPASSGYPRAESSSVGTRRPGQGLALRTEGSAEEPRSSAPSAVPRQERSRVSGAPGVQPSPSRPRGPAPRSPWRWPW